MNKSTRTKKKPSVVAQLLERLDGIEFFRVKSMFGGYGLYSRDQFFGIVWDNQVFFFTDQESRKKYKRRSMPQLQIHENQREGRYWQVPEAVMKRPAELNTWAQEAIECRRRSPVGTAKRAKQRAESDN